ncbi:EamA family transporter [Actinoallomurus spadix]|uniref:EamA family transporter n=1 Tax=Actinoallomurus spadix TaxID=79912 RepID=A0ABN0XQT2_9ACTN|nr:EamA family transporter [Actinoallomurus spadix]MCO5988292.1 EamA family transporter [Actinoallomurus spadix]
MALADAPGSYEGAGSLPPRSTGLRLSFGSIPPPALILLGIVSVQVGAGLAKNLFDRISPDAIVMLRLATSAIVLSVMARSALRDLRRSHSRRDLAVAVLFGLTLAGMNFSFYQAMARIPLGVAVTIEFLGPLTVSIVASRRRLDLLWAVLALGGVAMLARGGGDVSLTGVVFGLLAAVGWAAYILLSGATGKRFSGSTGLAIASVVGTLAVMPIGIATGGPRLLDPEILLIGLGVGLLSSVIPYSLELEALRRVPARVFGILMSVEPAVAALAGLVFLGEVLVWREWLAIGCVIAACVGATRFQDTPPEAPEA